jgi:dTDP-4-dehydrorhamnose 3,5-epimerase
MDPTTPLRPDQLLDGVRAQLTRQSYTPAPGIAGVVLADAPVQRAADGLFVELARLDDAHAVQGFAGVRPVQWNWSLVQPGGVKAWHVHLDQEDLWIVPPDATFLVGLADLRRDSPTAGTLQRLVLGAGRCDRLLIPRGVAHGVANLAPRAQAILYGVTRAFSPEPDRTDEWRLPWDRFGADFWSMPRG